MGGEEKVSLFSHSVVSDSLWTRGLQYARSPCPSPTPRVYSNSCLSSRWCHPTISSSIVTFSSCPQSFPASGSFQISQFFASGGQSIGVRYHCWWWFSCSVMSDSATPWTVARQAPLSRDSPGKNTGVGCQGITGSYQFWNPSGKMLDILWLGLNWI